MATTLAENRFDSPISTQEMLAQSPLGQTLLPVYEAAMSADSRIGKVNLVSMGEVKNKGLGYAKPVPGGGAEVHFRLGQSGITEIGIQMGLPLTRKYIAEEIGLKTSEVQSDLLAQFIFLHEIGHAVEFMNNSDDLEALSAKYDAELMRLPIPGWTPRKLREEGRELIEAHWEYLSKNLRVKTFDELYERQFNGFKKISSEKFADGFAARLLRRQVVKNRSLKNLVSKALNL